MSLVKTVRAVVPLPADVPTTHVYINFYRKPGRIKTTASVHASRELADAQWQPPKGGFQSGTQRVACIRVGAICIDGQFDL